MEALGIVDLFQEGLHRPGCTTVDLVRGGESIGSAPGALAKAISHATVPITCLHRSEACAVLASVIDHDPFAPRDCDAATTIAG